MGRLCLTLILLSFIPAPLFSATSQDLRSRIRIDGDVRDFSADEWILDALTTVPEAADDSRWGADNDVQRIALTWDSFNMYVAVPAIAVSTTLMLFVDFACGGVSDLSVAPLFQRNIEFSVNTPNILVKATRVANPQLAMLDCDNPINIVDPDAYESVFVQEGTASGALEVAIPWGLLRGFSRDAAGVVVPDSARSVRVVAAISGGRGTGAGDAAPNSSVVLENDSTRLAVLNNYAELMLDGDGDGLLDMGVSPRTIVTYAVTQSESHRVVLPLQLSLREKLIEPGKGISLDFDISLNPADYGGPVYLTARVYSSDGRLLRHLFDDESFILSGGGITRSWDGRDNRGNIVPGGIYVLAVSGGPGRDSSKHTVTASFAVIR